MPAPVLVDEADQILAASVALQRIAECAPRGTGFMRGTFYGIDGADLELQFRELPAVAATVVNLRCGLVHEVSDLERGERTQQLRRRHMWVGKVNQTSVMLWSWEDIDELPEPEPVEGARFPDPQSPAETVTAEAPAA
jgi:hypothetical protein